MLFLAKKQQIVVINKSDLLDDEKEKEILKQFKKEIGRKKRFILLQNRCLGTCYG